MSNNPKTYVDVAGQPEDVQNLVAAVTTAHDRREACKDELKKADEEFARLEQELAPRLIDLGLSVRTDRWVLSAVRSVSWHSPITRRGEIVDIVKAGIPNLVKETVNAGSLNAHLRKEEAALDAEGPAWWARLKAVLERSEELALSMTKAK